MQHFSVDDTIFLNLQSIVAAKVYRQILQYLGCTEGPRLTRFLGLGKNRIT